MLYPSINELLKKVDSRYTLVMLVSKRARQIVDGSKPLVKIDTDKPVSVAINEIDQNKLHFVTPDIKGLK